MQTPMLPPPGAAASASLAASVAASFAASVSLAASVAFGASVAAGAAVVAVAEESLLPHAVKDTAIMDANTIAVAFLVNLIVKKSSRYSAQHLGDFISFFHMTVHCFVHYDY